LRDIPREVGRLKKNLIEFDLRGTPLKAKLAQRQDSVEAVMAYLSHKDQRRILKEKLEESLREGIYREVADSLESTHKIKELVKSVFKKFQDNGEVNNLIRNCDRLFPANLDRADATKIREIFITLRRQNEMKKLAAELELRMRNIYFDRIDPQKVESIVRAIYEEIHELDDIKFLIKHASTLLPESSEDVDAKELRMSLVSLQEKLARERGAAIDSVFKALKGFYSDTEPDAVRKLTDETCALFKVTEDIKSLAADVHIHFPGDYLDAEPKAVKISYLKEKKAKGM